MDTNIQSEKIKESIIVWSVIIGIFAVLTFVAVNFDTIRNQFSSRSQSTTEKSVAEDIHQPGYPTVLSQPIAK